MEIIGYLWNTLVVGPLANGLVLLYAILGDNFGVAIISLTVITRVLLYPLTMRQLRSTKAMQQLQPRIKELQEKHKNDRQRLQREQMRLFKEAGVNPIGCLGPIMIQMPIWIGLFYAIRNTLADTPESLVSLSTKLYSWLPLVDEAVPLNSSFLGMNLGATPADQGGAAILLLPLLVGGSMYVVQKMSTLPGADPRQASMNNMMAWMFPLMFGFWTLSFPIGLAIYWIGSNIISIALQYRVTGWGGLLKQPIPAPAATGQGPRTRQERAVAPPEQPVAPEATSGPPAPPVLAFLRRVFLGGGPPPLPEPADSRPPEERPAGPRPVAERGPHGRTGDDRQDSRRSYRQGPEGARGRTRKRRSRRRR